MSIDVTINADSISAHSGKRLTTFVLRYPRFVHAEVMTHRVFARNASSSRAIPIQKMVKQVMEDPAMPERWGRNGKGMQDHGALSPEEQEEAKRLWLQARDNVLSVVGKMLARPEQPHKQIVNRLLEPWQHISVVLTGTEFANFFGLRYHPDADPTIEVLARRMWEAYEASEPKEIRHGQWHLPFIAPEDRAEVREHLLEIGPSAAVVSEEEITKLLLKLSTARCARVSYNDHYGKRPTIAKDLELHDMLVGSHPKHASPAEHQATPDTGHMEWFEESRRWAWHRPELHGPLVGWCQYRKTIPGENITTFKGPAHG